MKAQNQQLKVMNQAGFTLIDGRYYAFSFNGKGIARAFVESNGNVTIELNDRTDTRERFGTPAEAAWYAESEAIREMFPRRRC